MLLQLKTHVLSWCSLDSSFFGMRFTNVAYPCCTILPQPQQTWCGTVSWTLPVESDQAGHQCSGLNAKQCCIHPGCDWLSCAGVMGFHVAAPPSAVINMTEGNPIRISVQQGFDDPSVPQNEALSTQVLPVCLIHCASCACDILLRVSGRQRQVSGSLRRSCRSFPGCAFVTADLQRLH